MAIEITISSTKSLQSITVILYTDATGTILQDDLQLYDSLTPDKIAVPMYSWQLEQQTILILID
mgnify:FL=1